MEESLLNHTDIILSRKAMDSDLHLGYPFFQKISYILGNCLKSILLLVD